jgi:SAM-dependent methyltransferase
MIDDAVPGVDATVPSPARMYDYYLGGKDNYAADRDAAEQVIAAHPQQRLLARNNRAFLTRAVRHLADAGVDHYIDLGAGVPTEPATHQTARAIVPGARVVYVDEDPVVLAHARALLGTDDGIGVVGQDVLQPEQLLADPELTRLIDFSRPVGLLAVSLFHFSPDDGPQRVLRAFRERMAPGSWLVLSTGSDEGLSESDLAELDRGYSGTTRGMHLRSRAEVEGLFDGFAVVDPGVVDVSQWRGNAEQTPVQILAGVGRLG